MYIKLADLQQFYEMMDIATVITDDRYEVIWNNTYAVGQSIAQSGYVRNAIESSFGSQQLLQSGQPAILTRFAATSKAVSLTATPIGSYIVVQESNMPGSVPELEYVVDNVKETVGEMLTLLPVAIRSTNFDPIAMSSFDRIYQSCFSILRTTQNLSVLTKLANADELQDEVICLSELLATVADSCNAACENNPEQVHVNFQEPSTPVYIKCDRESLLVTVLNLIYNSMLFTQDDNKIEISCARMGNRVLVRISDNGLGMKPEFLKLVALPFYSVHPCYEDEELPGVGLGLCIAKEFTRHYAGTFHIESHVFEGSTVVLSLPAIDPPMELKQSPVTFKNLIANKFSPLYVQLHNVCTLKWEG